jgi:protocatechuate 3,4-dioxygenase, beta subunit
MVVRHRSSCVAALKTKSSIPLRAYRKPAPGVNPPFLHPEYVSSLKRAPTKTPVVIPQTLSEITGPAFQLRQLKGGADLTAQGAGEPLGQRIIVTGSVLDEDGKPVRNTLIEIWQANAAGRYHHSVDQHNAPLDPNFVGKAQLLTDDEGGYKFTTIKPGAYPWRNHPNAWRPAHIHFSLFGPAFSTRLVTQMYFPGDPLLPFDPIFNGIRDEAARQRLISNFDWKTTIPEQALGFRFDIVLRGRLETPMENRP